MIKFIHFMKEKTYLWLIFCYTFIPLTFTSLIFSSCAKMSTDYEINDVIY